MNRLYTLIILSLSAVSAFSSKTIEITDSTNEIWVSRSYVDYLVDTSNNLTIYDVLDKTPQFKSLTGDLINENPERHYWVHFKIKSLANAQSFRLELYDFDINEIEFYTIEDNNKVSVEKLGYNFPFGYRQVEHKNPGFNISIPKNQTRHYFIKFKSSRRNIFKPVIKSYETTLDYGLKEYLLIGIFYGLLLLMIFYNLLYFIILREYHYIFYVLYASCMLVYLMIRNGTAFQYLWPNNPDLNPYMDDFSLYFGTISMLLFTIHFLDLKNTEKNLRNIIFFAVLVRSAIFVYGVFANNNFQWIIVDVLFAQVAFVVGIKLLRDKVKAAKWFVIAFAIFDIGFLVTTFENIGLIDSSAMTVYSLNIGIVLQFVFLSIGIAESVKETYKQKNKAQAELLSFQEKTNEKLEGKVKRRTQELEQQKEIVEEKNNQIMASVRYAKTIQTATLPNEVTLNKINKNNFILYLPRDIVSGDFYWTYELSDSEYIIVAADCTGHGIPGAFMSMIGINLLNRIISEGHHVPNDILSELHHNIQIVLNQKESNNSDGMDIAICRVNRKQKLIDYAGAKNPLVYILNDKLHRIKATRKSIGGADQQSNLDFELHTISYEAGSVSFFLFSDGYADQFGGKEDRKFYLSNLETLFKENHHKPMKEQKRVLNETIENWIGYQEQIDDIMIVGIKEA